MHVQVGHSFGDLSCPIYQLMLRNRPFFMYHIVQGAVGAKLHYHAVVGGHGADSFEFHDVLVVEFPQMFNVRFARIFDFLHGDNGSVELPTEHVPLSSGSNPIQVAYIFKWDFPNVCEKQQSLPTNLIAFNENAI